MPISPEKQKLYPGGSINSKEWKAIREEVRERADDCCEWCGAPNGEMIQRSDDGRFWRWATDGETTVIFRAIDGVKIDPSVNDCWGLKVKIVCTVAHLNHNPTDNALENLAFLCQRCHLAYDAGHHKRNAAETRRTKMADGDLFAFEKKEPAA